MTAKRRKRASAPRGPLWRSDARERLRALLPELVISIIVSACLSTVVLTPSGTSILKVLVLMIIAQVYTQTVLYACTYLTHNDRFAGLGWMIVLFSMYAVFGMAFYATYPRDASYDLRFSMGISFMLGTVLFYASRTRPVFIFLLIEILGVSEIDEIRNPTLTVFLLGCGAMAALYVIRCSAARITLSYEPERDAGARDDDGQASRLLRLGVVGQAAALAIAIGALCLAATLASTPLLRRAMSTGNTVIETGTGTSTEPGQGTQVDGTQPGEGVADSGQGGSAGATTPEGSGTGSGEAAGSEGAGARQPLSTASQILLALLLPLLTVTLPFAVRLLVRAWRRRSVEREPRKADRLARIYQGILSRLEAAGIERDDADTPREFLTWQGGILADFTQPAGLGREEWTALTEAYERARYADLDPTESELETGWRLYDALPVCKRKEVGWRRYLLDAFWRM